MEFILREPAPSQSHRSWINIVTALGCFCVQQRSDRGLEKNSKFYSRYVKKSLDKSPFRIIHSLNPIDFRPEEERKSKKNLDDGTNRFVVAAATNLADIMEAFSLVRTSWNQVVLARSPTLASENEEDITTEAASAVPLGVHVPRVLQEASSKKSGSEKVLFTPGRWNLVWQRIQKNASTSKKRSENIEEAGETPKLSSPEPLAHTSRPLPSPIHPLSTPSAEETVPRPMFPTTTPQTSSSSILPLGPPQPPTRIPAAALETVRKEGMHFRLASLSQQFSSVTGNSSPQKQINAGNFSPLPQRAAESNSTSSSVAPNAPSPEKPTVPHRRKENDVQESMNSIERLSSTTLHSTGDETVRSVPSTDELPVSNEDSTAHESKDKNTLQHVAEGEIGRFALPKRGNSVFWVALCSFLSLAGLMVCYCSSYGFFIHGAAIVVLSGMVAAFFFFSQLSPASSSSLKQRSSSAPFTEPIRRCRKGLEKLSAEENNVLTQLQNFGAPYSTVVLRPLRGWNQKAETCGWSKDYLFQGLHYSERESPFSPSVLEVRAAINVPNASIGTMQSIFLSSFYPEDCDPAFAVQQNVPNFMFPLRERVEVVRQLEHNLFIVRAVDHSRILGVQAHHTYYYASPAVLLDPEQQRELHLRHPFYPQRFAEDEPSLSTEAQEDHEKAPILTSSSAAGYAYMVSLVHCPPAALEKLGVVENQTSSKPSAEAILHHQVWIGFEEDDGSLTLCVYRSLCLDALDSVPPPCRHSIYRDILYTMLRVASTVEERGRMANELRTYRNNRLYCPFLTHASEAASASSSPNAHSPQQERSPKAPPGIHWSSSLSVTTEEALAVEPFSGLAGHKASTSIGASPRSSSHHSDAQKDCGSTLPSSLDRFLRTLSALEGSRSWRVVSNQSQKGMKISFCADPSNHRMSMLKTDIYFPFQTLEAIEMSLVSSLGLPAFEMNLSRRKPLRLPTKVPVKPQEVGVIPIETIFKVGGEERLVAPRTITMEMINGVYFTRAQLNQWLADEVLQQIPEVQSLPGDTLLFFYGGETPKGQELQQHLPPLQRPLYFEVPCYGFLCWQSSSPLTSDPSPSSSPSKDGDRARATSGTPLGRGVRVITLIHHHSIRAYRWRRIWGKEAHPIQRIEKMVQNIRDGSVVQVL